MSGENCLILTWHSSRAAPGISLSRVPTKDDEHSKKWRNNIVAVITRDTVMNAISKDLKNRTIVVALSSRKHLS